MFTMQEARKLLETRGHRPVSIVRVDEDSVLFTVKGAGGKGLRPRTAWLMRQERRLIVSVEDGFPAEPSPGTLATIAET